MHFENSYSGKLKRSVDQLTNGRQAPQLTAEQEKRIMRLVIYENTLSRIIFLHAYAQISLSAHKKEKTILEHLKELNHLMDSGWQSDFLLLFFFFLNINDVRRKLTAMYVS